MILGKPSSKGSLNRREMKLPSLIPRLEFSKHIKDENKTQTFFRLPSLNSKKYITKFPSRCSRLKKCIEKISKSESKKSIFSSFEKYSEFEEEEEDVKREVKKFQKKLRLLKRKKRTRGDGKTYRVKFTYRAEIGEDALGRTRINEYALLKTCQKTKKKIFVNIFNENLYTIRRIRKFDDKSGNNDFQKVKRGITILKTLSLVPHNFHTFIEFIDDFSKENVFVVKQYFNPTTMLSFSKFVSQLHLDHHSTTSIDKIYNSDESAKFFKRVRRYFKQLIHLVFVFHKNFYGSIFGREIIDNKFAKFFYDKKNDVLILRGDTESIKSITKNYYFNGSTPGGCQRGKKSSGSRGRGEKRFTSIYKKESDCEVKGKKKFFVRDENLSFLELEEFESDIFSLGIVLHHLVFGCGPVFRKGKLVLTSGKKNKVPYDILKILVRICRKEPKLNVMQLRRYHSASVRKRQRTRRKLGLIEEIYSLEKLLGKIDRAIVPRKRRRKKRKK